MEARAAAIDQLSADLSTWKMFTTINEAAMASSPEGMRSYDSPSSESSSRDDPQREELQWQCDVDEATREEAHQPLEWEVESDHEADSDARAPLEHLEAEAPVMQHHWPEQQPAWREHEAAPAYHEEENVVDGDLAYRGAGVQDDELVMGEARRITHGLRPTEAFADRQRSAHALATELARSAEAATALTTAFRDDPYAHPVLLPSLLQLADEADEAADALTGDIVLACLTNLSGEETGAGIALCMAEPDAIAAHLARVLLSTPAETSTLYACGCLSNLKAQPAVLAAVEAAPPVVARLRQLCRAQGDTGTYARALDRALQARTKPASRPASASVRRESLGSGFGGLSPRADRLNKTVRRVASFGRVGRKTAASCLADSDLSFSLLANAQEP